MNALFLALAHIRARPLQSFLCALAAMAGMTLLTAAFTLASAFESGLKRNAAGIDIVAGAKGSPLQLVLSTLYHIDVPAGNMDAASVKMVMNHPDVARAIPLSMGDSYRGFRLIGTTPDFLNLYKAEIHTGTLPQNDFDVLAGADTGLAVGHTFTAMHGLSAGADGHAHADIYTVTGVLAPTGTVADRLLLTSVDAVRDSHAHHDHDSHDHDHDHDHDLEHDHKHHHHDDAENYEGITAILIQTRSRTATMNLPRTWNEDGRFVAANPALVMTRLSRDLGVGQKTLAAVGGGFVLLSALMILAVLASGIASRKYDLAVLRVLGAPPAFLGAAVMLEGVLIAFTGTAFGIICGHLLAYAAAGYFGAAGLLMTSASLLMPSVMDLAFLAGGVLCGLAGGLLPALLAMKTDVAGLLAKGRL